MVKLNKDLLESGHTFPEDLQVQSYPEIPTCGKSNPVWRGQFLKGFC